MMSYSIEFIILGEKSLESQIDSSATIIELIQFLLENFSELGDDSSFVIITSKAFNKQLNQNQTLREILGNRQNDTFLVEIKTVKIMLEYQQQIIECEVSVTITLQQLFDYFCIQFNIQKQVQMILNNQNLSELSQQFQLKDIQIQNGSKIVLIEIKKVLIIKKQIDNNYKIKLKIRKENYKATFTFKFESFKSIQDLIHYLFDKFSNFIEGYNRYNIAFFSKNEQKRIDYNYSLGQSCPHQKDKWILQKK